MQNAKRIFAAAGIIGLALSSVANAGWLHFANSVVQAEAESEKHPKTLTQVLVMPEEAVEPSFCVSYSNTTGQGNKGQVAATAKVLHLDGKTQTLKFAGGAVEDNGYFRCKKGPDLEGGAVVTFDYDFTDMPRLRSESGAAELAEASGVVSTAGQPKLGQAAPLGLTPKEGSAPLGIVPADKGGWFHSAKSVFQPDKSSQKHPKALAHLMVIPSESKKPQVCIAYSNTAKDKNKGRVVTKVSISHTDGSEESLKFAGGVRKNEYLKCKKAARMGAGDIVGFSYKLKGMPRLSSGTDFADINGVVSTSGDPLFREPPPPPPAPEPEPEPKTAAPVETAPAPTQPATPPPPPPATGGGGISAADEQAAFRLLKSAKVTQLHRAKANSPDKWVVFGPKTKFIPGTREVDPKTWGQGSTIAAAVAAYEKKFGSLGASGSLSGTEKSLLGWYSGMNAVAGPTAVRRDGQGRWHGEYYRPSHGAQHNGPLGSLEAALDWLKKQGL